MANPSTADTGGVDANVFAFVGAIAFVLGFFLCAKYICCRDLFLREQTDAVGRSRHRFCGKWPYRRFNQQCDQFEAPLLTEEQATLRRQPSERAAILPSSTAETFSSTSVNAL